MKAIKRVLYSLLPLVALLAGGEVAVRVSGWPAVNPDRPFEHNEVYWIAEPDLEDQAFPHREMNTSFPVSTDHRGLRAPLHEEEKPAGTLRVLFLGCSTTFGWGVADEETYPARVEALLHEAGRTDVEVINGGQPGYTSFQGLWFWREVARTYRPDLVFFGYVVQDARKAAYTDRSQALLQADARFLKDNLFYHSRMYLGLRQVIDARRVVSKERAEGGSEGAYRVPPEDYVANIRELHRLVGAEGARLVFFGFPLEREGYTRDHRRLLRAAAEELSVPNLDLQAEMESLSRQSVLYFEQDRGHANREGHEVIARKVVEFLTTRSLLGARP